MYSPPFVSSYVPYLGGILLVVVQELLKQLLTCGKSWAKDGRGMREAKEIRSCWGSMGWCMS